MSSLFFYLKCNSSVVNSSFVFLFIILCSVIFFSFNICTCDMMMSFIVASFFYNSYFDKRQPSLTPCIIICDARAPK